MGAGPSEAPNGPGNNRAAEIRRWQFIEKYLRKSSGRPYNHPATFPRSVLPLNFLQGSRVTRQIPVALQEQVLVPLLPTN
jgi:hypothetical protein